MLILDMGLKGLRDQHFAPPSPNLFNMRALHSRRQASCCTSIVEEAIFLIFNAVEEVMDGRTF